MPERSLKVDLTWWCHNSFGPKWDIDTFIKRARDIGAVGIELAPVEHWQKLQKAELTCPVAILDFGKDKPPFAIGWNDPTDHPAVIAETLKQIENCRTSEGVCNMVIAFSGMRKPGINKKAAIANCVSGLKQVMPEAEKEGVTVLFECLNDKKEGAEAWKGHPGYDATTLDFGLEVVKGVGSPRCKLVVDLFHVQRQEGNVIQNLEMVKDHVGHIHAAGHGQVIRQEMNVGYQDLDHRGIFRYIRSWYQGGVGIEYIPTHGRPYKNDLQATMKLING